MFLLNLAVIQSCNYDCYYCTMKEWTYPIDHVFGDGKKANRLTNEILFKWIDAFLNPNEWMIKITGGEPGLYPEIEGLVLGLAQRGYRGIIETNGSLPIPKTDNFIRLGAWHLGKPFPVYYDAIVIIQNKNDNWQEKIDHCEKKGIKYLINMQRGASSPWTLEERHAEDATHEKTHYERQLMLYSAGNFQSCPMTKASYGSIFDMVKPMPFLITTVNCQTCPQFHGMDRLIKWWEEDQSIEPLKAA